MCSCWTHNSDRGSCIWLLCLLLRLFSSSRVDLSILNEENVPSLIIIWYAIFGCYTRRPAFSWREMKEEWIWVRGEEGREGTPTETISTKATLPCLRVISIRVPKKAKEPLDNKTKPVLNPSFNFPSYQHFFHLKAYIRYFISTSHPHWSIILIRPERGEFIS